MPLFLSSEVYLFYYTALFQRFRFFVRGTCTNFVYFQKQLLQLMFLRKSVDSLDKILELNEIATNPDVVKKINTLVF